MEAYGSCSSTNNEKNQTMRNILRKYLLRLRRMTLTNELHMHLNMLKITVVCKSNVLRFVNEVIFERSPDIYIYKYFVVKNNQYDMRRKGQLNAPSCRTQICDKVVRVFGASLWNRLGKCMLRYRFKETVFFKYFLSRCNVWIILDANTKRCISNWLTRGPYYLLQCLTYTWIRTYL